MAKYKFIASWGGSIGGIPIKSNEKIPGVNFQIGDIIEGNEYSTLQGDANGGLKNVQSNVIVAKVPEGRQYAGQTIEIPLSVLKPIMDTGTIIWKTAEVIIVAGLIYVLYRAWRDLK